MKSKRIKVPIYGGELVIKLVKNWKKVNKKFGFEIGDDWDGVTFRSIENNQYFCNVYFLGKPSISTMVHESVHAVNDIFKYRHAKLDIDNDEHQAYFTEWVFTQIENYFEEWTLKEKK